MTVTPDGVEAAARLVFPDEFRKFDWWRSLEPGRPVLNSIDRDEAELIARVAAAAPLIAKQTLLDAAEEITAKTPHERRSQDFCAGMENAAHIVRARAATLTPKEKS